MSFWNGLGLSDTETREFAGGVAVESREALTLEALISVLRECRATRVQTSGAKYFWISDAQNKSANKSIYEILIEGRN